MCMTVDSAANVTAQYWGNKEHGKTQVKQFPTSKM